MIKRTPCIPCTIMLAHYGFILFAILGSLNASRVCLLGFLGCSRHDFLFVCLLVIWFFCRGIVLLVFWSAFSDCLFVCLFVIRFFCRGIVRLVVWSGLFVFLFACLFVICFFCRGIVRFVFWSGSCAFLFVCLFVIRFFL